MKTLLGWRYRGGVPPFVKVGRCVRYRHEDLQAFVLEELRTSTSDPEATSSGRSRIRVEPLLDTTGRSLSRGGSAGYPRPESRSNRIARLHHADRALATDQHGASPCNNSTSWRAGNEAGPLIPHQRGDASTGPGIPRGERLVAAGCVCASGRRERTEARSYNIWFLWNCDAVSKKRPKDFATAWRDRADLT